MLGELFKSAGLQSRQLLYNPTTVASMKSLIPYKDYTTAEALSQRKGNRLNAGTSKTSQSQMSNKNEVNLNILCGRRRAPSATCLKRKRA